MEEMNSDNSQYKYEDLDRPYGYGKNNPYGWKQQQCPYGKCPHGSKWPNWYGPYFPGGYYGGGFGFPWFLLALKSLSPRDAIRLIDEMEGMDFNM